jgi:uncharacterized membrane protein YhaH (DUF805 family)
VKRSGRDKPMWVAMYMCIETILEISLYSYLYLKLAKTICLFFTISYVFSSTKSENKMANQVLAQKWGVGEGGGPNNIYTCE